MLSPNPQVKEASHHHGREDQSLNHQRREVHHHPQRKGHLFQNQRNIDPSLNHQRRVNQSHQRKANQSHQRKANQSHQRKANQSLQRKRRNHYLKKVNHHQNQVNHQVISLESLKQAERVKKAVVANLDHHLKIKNKKILILKNSARLKKSEKFLAIL